MDRQEISFEMGSRLKSLREEKRLSYQELADILFEKYGVKVYSLDEDNTDVNAIYNEALKMIKAGTIKYVFVKGNEEYNSTVQRLIQNTGVTVQNWDTLSNLTETQRTEKEDYFTIMNENLELLKNELYK